MILVDVKPESSQKDSLADAINSLVKTTEFSKANYGSNAIAISHLDNELKDLLTRTDLSPETRLREYDQRLQKYLFLLRETDKNNVTPSRPSPVGVALLPKIEPEETASVAESGEEEESDRRSPGPSPGPFIFGSPFVSTPPPKTLRTPQQPSTSSTVKTTEQATNNTRSNLPRTTPIEERLRKKSERRKNSRFQDFWINWSPHATK